MDNWRFKTNTLDHRVNEPQVDKIIYLRRELLKSNSTKIIQGSVLEYHLATALLLGTTWMIERLELTR